MPFFITCPECGKGNLDWRTHCKNCGARLPEDGK